MSKSQKELNEIRFSRSIEQDPDYQSKLEVVKERLNSSVMSTLLTQAFGLEVNKLENTRIRKTIKERRVRNNLDKLSSSDIKKTL